MLGGMDSCDEGDIIDVAQRSTLSPRQLRNTGGMTSALSFSFTTWCRI
ncbi:MAG: hypothetical protein ACLSAP_01295 [Oscillospiraceae bacterium]